MSRRSKVVAASFCQQVLVASGFAAFALPVGVSAFGFTCTVTPLPAPLADGVEDVPVAGTVVMVVLGPIWPLLISISD